MREGARKINAECKGYTPDDLATELNKKEIDDRRKRRKRNNHHLDRVYFSIPDSIPEFEIPPISSKIRFNVSDCKSAIYNINEDCLYMTSSRCACSICITDSFIKCSTIHHHLHKLSMHEITSSRTYPKPSPANSIPFITTSPRKEKAESPKVKNIEKIRPRTRASKKAQINIEAVKISGNQRSEPVLDNKTSSNVPQKKVEVLEDVFPHAKSLDERKTWIPAARLQRIECNLSNDDIALAKLEMTKMENHSRSEHQQMGYLDEYDASPFRRSQEYELGDVDLICSRFRGRYGPKMNGAIQKQHQTQIMTASTLNSLIRLLLNGSFESSEDFIALATDEFPNGLPSAGFESLIIPVFSTVGMKRNFKKKIFKYDNSAGHFITLLMKMSTSEIHIYDHLNEDMTKSAYFDFELISKVLQSIHSHHKHQRGEEITMLKYIQHNLKNQTDSNCGVHCIVNVELLLNDLNPAFQSFDRKLMDTIRCYHLLLKELLIHNYRIDLKTD